MKKKILIIITIILFVILALYLFLPDNIKIKVSYEYYNYFNDGKIVEVDIPIHNNFNYINNKETEKLFKDGTGVIYFGYSSCPWCRSVIGILNEVAVSNSIDIYYFDTKSSNYNNYFKENIIPYIEKYLRRDSSNNKKLYVPDVYFIKDGKIIGHHIGSLESHTDPYKELSNKEKKELIKIYNDLLEEVIK